MPQKKPDRPHSELVLKHPLVQGSDQIDVLYILRPRGKEMGLLPTTVMQKGGTLGDLHPWTAMLAGLTVRELELLDVEDYVAVQTKVGEFINEFPSTGPSAPSSSAVTPTGG